MDFEINFENELDHAEERLVTAYLDLKASKKDNLKSVIERWEAFLNQFGCPQVIEPKGIFNSQPYA